MNQLKDQILGLFREQNAPLSIEEVCERFLIYSPEEVETILDELWEADVLCKLESFCSILYALED